MTVSNPAFNGYYSIFPPQNLERHSHLIFWAKGDAERGYPRSFKVEIKDGQTAAGYVVEGLTDRWRRFAIPLREFRGIRDWTVAGLDAPAGAGTVDGIATSFAAWSWAPGAARKTPPPASPWPGTRTTCIWPFN